MNESAKLRKYLLKSFLITLILVGIAQLISGAIITTIFNPMAENVLSLNGILSGKNLKETTMIIAESFLLLVLEYVAGSISVATRFVFDEYAKEIFDPAIFENIANVANQMSSETIGWYVAKAILFIVFELAFIIAPYVIGGIIFAKSVSKKVDEIEAARIEKDREFERQRNLLLSDIAHDIKTPITTVAGFSKALADGEVDESQRQDYLDSVYRKSMQISDLVSLLFEYVKLDSSGYQLHMQKLDVCESMRECIAALYADFEDKNMELDLSIPDETINVNLDSMQFTRAINNILTNMQKHNPPGTKIMVDVFREEKHTIAIEISDTGDFIEREIAKHLFDPFVQGDSSRQTGKGSGLGLSITKKIIKMHGGSISLIQYKDKDKYKKTKTFRILLPTAR